MSSKQGGADPLEIALVLFLILVLIVALLTILGPQIESLVERLTGR